MKCESFKCWLEGQDDYQNIGVPHFANPGSTAIRGPADNQDSDGFLRRKNLVAARRNQKVVRPGEVLKFPTGLHTRFRGIDGPVVDTAIVTFVGKSNATLSIDGRKMQMQVRTLKRMVQSGKAVKVEPEEIQ